MSAFRIALIGAGVIGQTHAATLARNQETRLVGIADPSPAARAVAEAHGVPWHDDAAQMLDAVRPDAAIVATPNQDHLAGGLACIRRGVHVLIEKPIADTLAASVELAEAAERAGVHLLVGHHRRHNPIITAARQAIAEGRLGRVTAISVAAILLKPDAYFDVAWRRQSGGGPILINLIHEIDLLRFLCGEIDTVQAMRTSNARNLPVEDTAAVLLGFCSGALAAITLSDAVPSPWSWDLASGENAAWPRNDVATHLIAGTDASLSLPGLELWRYSGARGWAEKLVRETLPHQQASPYERQIRHLCAVLRGAEAPLCGGRDAARTLAATLAVHEAAATGKRVQPHAVPAPPPTDATA